MKIIRILTITILATHQVKGQSDTIVNLAQVEIMAERLATPFSASSRSIQLLTRREISQLPAMQVAELLSYVPGLDIRQRGPQGVQADLSIRGGSFDQSLVLINGIKLSDPQTGHHLLNLVLQPEQIERIEILRGPGTRIYGPNAFSGTVNLIARNPDKKELAGTLSLGQFGLRRGDVTLSMPIGNWKQSISVGRSAGDGYRFNTDFKQQNYLYQSSWKSGDATWRTLAGYNDKAFGANGFYANENAKDQYEETRTLMGAVSMQLDKKWGQLNAQAYHRQHRDIYLFLRQNPAFYRNEHHTRVSAAEANLQFRNPWGKGAVGAELRREEIVSNNLGNHTRNHIGLYLEQRFTLGRWLLTPGIFHHYMSDYGLKLYPGMDLSFHLKAGPSFFANVARSFRVPTYTDLFYVGPANHGNPDLLPESAWTWELGGRWLGKRWQGAASFFQRDASRIIEWVRNAPQSKWRPENYLGVNTRGFEASLTFAPEGRWLSSMQVNLAWLNMDPNLPPGFQSRYLLENLTFQSSVLLYLRLPGEISLTPAFRLFRRASQEAPVFLLDAQVSRPLGKSLTIFLVASNLFDAVYREIGTVPMPGRWLRGGLRFRL